MKNLKKTIKIIKRFIENNDFTSIIDIIIIFLELRRRNKRKNGNVKK